MDVSKLAKNINKINNITEIDIVLEGGCMNGAYEIGGLLLIKELEKHKNLRVTRISGASVGSFVGFLYLTKFYKHIQLNTLIIFNVALL